MNPILVGADPGLAHFGFVVVALHATGEEVLDLGIIKTEKSDAKRKVLAADDNVRRVRELVWTLDKVLGAGTRAVCAESMSHPRGASAAGKLSLSWGVLVTLVHLRQLPILQASPQEVKRAVVGRKDASKEEVADALVARYGSGIVRKLDEKKIPQGQREHAFDALAAVVASLDSDLMRLLRAGLTGPAIDTVRRLDGGGVG